MADILSQHESEKLQSCPYDKGHQILAKRMQTHLVRCRRQHLDAEKTSCAYNSKHVVPKPELKFHLDTCPDRKNMDKFVYVREDVNCNKYEMPKVEVTFDEVWDDNNPTYDPTAYVEANPILRMKSTLSAAQRKEFRHSERKRIQECQELQHKKFMHLDNAPVRKPAFHQSGAVRTGLTNEDDPYTVESLMQKISADVQLNKARNTAQQETRMECGTSDGDNSTTHEEFPSIGWAGGARRKQPLGTGRGRR